MSATKSDFDQVFEEMSAPDYPATCNECGFEASNAEMEAHECETHTPDEDKTHPVEECERRGCVKLRRRAES